MSDLALFLLFLLNLPLFYGLMRAFFGDVSNFLQAIRFLFTPDIFSAFRGEYWDDLWNELKLAFYLLLCAGLLWSEYTLLLSFLR